MRVTTLINIAMCVSLAVFCLPILAEENLQIVDVEVNTDQGQPALVVNFNQSIRYRGFLPNRKAREFNVQLQKQLPVVQGDQALESRHQNISVPHSDAFPIEHFELIIEGDDVHLSLLFSKQVLLRVGQFSGSNSVTIILQKEAFTEGDIGLESKDENREQAMMAAGKRALRLGDNALAIRIFNNLVSLPENPYTRDALELLGLARERNDQLAQAKLIYDQYLTKYTKEDDGRIRVKQRLANLLEIRQKPKQKLKKTGKKIHQAYSLLTFSQFYYRGLSGTSGQTSANSESQLNSRFSYLWRKRSSTREVKHYFYAYNLYDFESKDTNGLASSPNDRAIISTAYSRIKDKDKNYAASVGRQTSQGGGVLGRYDGVDLSYGIASKVKVGLNLGSPVGITDKDRIQKEKKFISTRLDFDDFFKDWNFSTYLYSQTQEGYTDRRSFGGEIRYFSQGVSLFSQVDYDFYFSEMTIYLLRLQSKFGDSDTLIFNVDSRRMLETSNALISSSETTLDQLASIYTEDAVKEKALSNTPNSNLTTLGWNHSFANQWESNFDYSKGVTLLNDLTFSPEDRQSDYQALNLLLTKSNLLQKNDLLFITMRYSTSDTSNKTTKDTSTWISHRSVFRKYRLLGKLKLSHRSNSDGGTQNISEPSFKINYRFGKDNDLEFETGIQFVKYGGNSVEEDYTYKYFNLGYQLYF